LAWRILVPFFANCNCANGVSFWFTSFLETYMFSLTDIGWMQADGGGSLEDSGVTKGGGCGKLKAVSWANEIVLLEVGPGETAYCIWIVWFVA
jgi:hypothetical protein